MQRQFKWFLIKNYIENSFFYKIAILATNFKPKKAENLLELTKFNHNSQRIILISGVLLFSVGKYTFLKGKLKEM